MTSTTRTIQTGRKWYWSSLIGLFVGKFYGFWAGACRKDTSPIPLFLPIFKDANLALGFVFDILSENDIQTSGKRRYKKP